MVIQLGQRSIENPIIRTLVNPKYKSIPIFFKQPGSISNKHQTSGFDYGSDASELDQEEEQNEVYFHKLVSKIKAHEPSGVSRHTVWSLDRDPCIEPVSREDLCKFLESLNPGKKVTFYKESGEEIDGDRVVEPEDLARLIQLLPEMRARSKERYLDEADF